MKTLAMILTLITAVAVNSQTSYEKGMKKAFELWGDKKPDEAINLFERIARAEKENWLPFYYAGQVHIITTFGLKDATEIETRLKKAQDFLNEAKTFSKDNAEILIMEAMLNTAYVVYNPSVYGMTHSAKVEELYQKAKALEPKNPRAMLYHAEWKMGGAKFWGKDPKAFCPEIEKAILYFENETKRDIPFYPKWGLDQVERIQQNCK
ncbi:hypothetical protein U6A24_12230 [Aquimarina gracilis]|uniref:Tetratricopeptide repeat protein n=1 Tax=Aquimarina gracilis TaxID=874422 RepID=A0ABU5ZWJ8_9FLAO|nr:hypothetical protein [Aquimarina gracilis]MEB3346236.1 hypothetical protein [Aquimarina gracilis]